MFPSKTEGKIKGAQKLTMFGSGSHSIKDTGLLKRTGCRDYYKIKRWGQVQREITARIVQSGLVFLFGCSDLSHKQYTQGQFPGISLINSNRGLVQGWSFVLLSIFLRKWVVRMK